MSTIHREIHPEIRVLDPKAGLVEYVASDETLDHYREIIRADGWRFSHFRKNAPFVDSHDYSTIEKLLGSVVEFRVEGKRLIEVVKWEPEASPLAKIGFAMTQAGHLKAVSVGFIPTKYVDRYSNGGADLQREALAMGLAPEAAAAVRAIYLEHEQIELSACIIGANPAALARVARAYKCGALGDDDIDALAGMQRAADRDATGGTPVLPGNAGPGQRDFADDGETARGAEIADAAARAEGRRRQWLREFEKAINGK